jgi:hypothetical protein
MALNRPEARLKLRDAEQDFASGMARLRNGKSSIALGQSQLGGLSTKYSDLVAWINSEAANNPNDESAQDLKRQKDDLVAAFQAGKLTADAMVTDLTSYDP